MQRANLTLRLGGSQLHTVPIVNATPAEILVLQRIHGNDAVVDVRPTEPLKAPRHAEIYEALSTKYDRAASNNAPGEDSKSIMAELFPGAMKKLPTTLKEIGLVGYERPVAQTAKADVAEPVSQVEEDIFAPADVDGDDGVTGD